MLPSPASHALYHFIGSFSRPGSLAEERQIKLSVSWHLWSPLEAINCVLLRLQEKLKMLYVRFRRPGPSLCHGLTVLCQGKKLSLGPGGMFLCVSSDGHVCLVRDPHVKGDGDHECCCLCALSFGVWGHWEPSVSLATLWSPGFRLRIYTRDTKWES